MGVWSTTTPAGSDLLSQGDDNIRASKSAIQEALRAGAVAGDNIEGVEAIFPGASPSTAPVYRYRGLKDTTANRPTAGQYGLFFDTTRNVLQRDNGTSWDDVGAVIPSGTKMVFYQASAPVGWTAVALNDKFLRVVTAGGTGGSTGGTMAASTSLTHTHTLAHTHDLSNHTHSTPVHTHTLSLGGGSGLYQQGLAVYTTGAGGAMVLPSGSTPHETLYPVNSTTVSGGSGTSGNPSSNVSGAASSDTTSSVFSGVFAYADIIVCSKD
jgi:hypothetical protein